MKEIISFITMCAFERSEKGMVFNMNISEINLNKITNEELLDIYNRTKEFIEELDNETKANEVEKKK